MSNAAIKEAKRFRQARSTPKGGESPVATLARGLMGPDNRTNWRVGPNGELYRNRVYENFTAYKTTDQVACYGMGGAALATTTAVMQHMVTPNKNTFGIGNIGVQTTRPVMDAAGLDIRGVETNAIGTEFVTHFNGASGGGPFIIGTDPAFYFETSLTVADISGCTVLLAGFRRAENFNVTYTGYLDYGAIGIIASAATGAINIAQEINNAGTAPTDTTDTWADGATKKLRINVSSAGVITYKLNGVAPTVVAAQTFDAGDPVIPFVHFIQHTDIAGLITMNTWDCGFQ